MAANRHMASEVGSGTVAVSVKSNENWSSANAAPVSIPVKLKELPFAGNVPAGANALSSTSLSWSDPTADPPKPNHEGSSWL